jgi:hypothetical protein
MVKDLVTSRFLTIESKFKDSFQQANFLNFILTTNKATATLVDDESRRDVIFNIQQKDQALMERLGKELVAWCLDGGYEFILDWYYKRDISGYSARSKAPRFLGFEDSVFASKSNATIALDTVMDAISDFGKGMALTSREANDIYASFGFKDVKQVRREETRHPVYIKQKAISVKGVKIHHVIYNEELSNEELLKNGREFIVLVLGALGVGDSNF